MAARAPAVFHTYVSDVCVGTPLFLEEGMGAPSAVGDATWKHTFFNTANWATLGGDFNPVASGIQSVPFPFSKADSQKRSLFGESGKLLPSDDLLKQPVPLRW